MMSSAAVSRYALPLPPSLAGARRRYRGNGRLTRVAASRSIGCGN